MLFGQKGGEIKLACFSKEIFHVHHDIMSTNSKLERTEESFLKLPQLSKQEIELDDVKVTIYLQRQINRYSLRSSTGLCLFQDCGDLMGSVCM